MILSEVRHYLRQRGQASLDDIALHFDADPMAVRGMLDIWIRKGKAHKQNTAAQIQANYRLFSVISNPPIRMNSCKIPI